MPLTDYEKYIRTEELLALQKPAEALSCHDELQFQVVHQAHELYMKLIEHELRFFVTLLHGEEPARLATSHSVWVPSEMIGCIEYDGTNPIALRPGPPNACSSCCRISLEPLAAHKFSTPTPMPVCADR